MALRAFVSETEAYFFALNDGKIIKFNPATMSITETIAVTPLPLSNDAAVKTKMSKLFYDQNLSFASLFGSMNKIIQFWIARV